jgi:8-oxo-dGTP pyrophosphatase MutT (NUDIX family)
MPTPPPLPAATTATANNIPAHLLGPPGLPRKLYTLVVPHQPTPDPDVRRVLLGKKLRGFGEGFWNGFGGKVDPEDESVAAAAARELHEEAGIAAPDLHRRGILTFIWDDQPDQPAWEVHVFGATQLDGTPVQSDEMSPGWHDARLDRETQTVHGLPFDQMWADDPLWYPLMLAGDRPLFMGTFHFRDTTVLVGGEVARVAELPKKKL